MPTAKLFGGPEHGKIMALSGICHTVSMVKKLDFNATSLVEETDMSASYVPVQTVTYRWQRQYDMDALPYRVYVYEGD